jgi:hypothetical protein
MDWKVNFDCDSYEFRYQALGSQQRVTLRLPSAVNDLHACIIGFRDDSKDSQTPTAAQNNLQNFRGYQAINQFQLFVESRPWFAEQLTADKTQLMLWKETRKSQPNIIYSRYYTDYERPADDGTMFQPPIILNMQAAPRFKDMKSGVATHRHTVEAYADITFNPGFPGNNVNAFCWMKHTARIYEDSFGQLHVQK